MERPPEFCDVVVIGGGPAGATAASLLAREGFSCVILEKDRFPRYHIGESLLPSLHPMLDLIGVGEKVRSYGFVVKVAGFFHIKKDLPPGKVDFRKNIDYKYSYQVIRSEFDHLLLQHARGLGALVYEETIATQVEFDETGTARAVCWQGQGEGRIGCRFVIDASGQSGILASRQLGTRVYQEEFANVALGSYYKGHRPYVDAAGEAHPGSFVMEAFHDGSGWTWAIPLHDGSLSVGVVLHRDTHRAWHDELGNNEKVYQRCLDLCPVMVGMLAPAERYAPIRVWSDYSYMASQFAGTGWRLAGDAAGFIDPLFSSGVHLAMLGGLVAAASIGASIRGDTTEAEAGSLHDALLRRAYTRWMIAVAGFYRQIRSQERMVLPGVDAASFHRAFEAVEPLFFGSLEAGVEEVPEAALRAAMDLGGKIWMEVYNVPTGSGLAKFMGRVMPDKNFDIDLRALDGWVLRLKPGSLGMERQSVLAAAGASLGKVLARSLLMVVSRFDSATQSDGRAG